MPGFVARMEELSEDKRISSRVRFRIKDVLDLKRRNWIQREGQKVKVRPGGLCVVGVVWVFFFFFFFFL